jgi:Barstar, RNAse (barnase) inhibitor
VTGGQVYGVLRVAVPAATVAAEARLRGATVGVVDGLPERRAVLTAIGRVLRFPAYYGRNLDALEECLTDLSWLPAGEVMLVWEGSDTLRRTDPKGHRELLELLGEVVEATATSRRTLRVVLADAP